MLNLVKQILEQGKVVLKRRAYLLSLSLLYLLFTSFLILILVTLSYLQELKKLQYYDEQHCLNAVMIKKLYLLRVFFLKINQFPVASPYFDFLLFSSPQCDLTWPESSLKIKQVIIALFFSDNSLFVVSKRLCCENINILESDWD